MVATCAPDAVTCLAANGNAGTGTGTGTGTGIGTGAGGIAGGMGTGTGMGSCAIGFARVPTTTISPGLTSTHLLLASAADVACCCFPCRETRHFVPEWSLFGPAPIRPGYRAELSTDRLHVTLPMSSAFEPNRHLPA
jgi:hypothetical protein